jgi:hypothetical protein
MRSERTSWLSIRAFIALSLLGLSVLPAFAQAPTNDFFLNRTPIELSAGSWLATNTLATSEPGELAHRGLPPVRSLWWNWRIASNGYAVVSTTNSPSHTRVEVYDYQKILTQLGRLSLETNSGIPVAPDRFEFSATRDIDYKIAVDGRDGESGAIQLDLKVFTSPEILAQPLGTNVVAGQRGSIAVVALGKLALSYQWQLSQLSPNTGFSNLFTNNRRLDIGANGVINTNDQGWYRVIASNEYGSITSAVARVNVSECATPNAPQPASITTNVGKTIAFAASALGTPPLQFQWQFKAPGQPNFSDILGSTNSNLVITNVSTDVQGDYRFVVSNIACTNTSTNSSLFVTTNNALVLDPGLPADLTLITNQSATFHVLVTEGFQPISYQWWFSPTSQTNKLLGQTATNLFLSGVQLNDAGLYWAIVSNRYQSVTSRLARLSIELRPPNDDFANRIPFFPPSTSLSTTNLSVTNVFGSNKNATAEPGEHQHQGHSPRLSIWWSFIAPTNGQLVAELTSSDPSQLLGAYTGFYVDDLTPVINASNRLDRFEFLALTGTEYSFAVDTTNTAFSPNIALRLTFNPGRGPTILIQPGDDCPEGAECGGGVKGKGGDFDVVGDLGGGEDGCTDFTGLRVQATSLDGGLYYQWQFGPTTNGPFADLPGMTNSMLILQNVTIADEGWYRAAVRNNANLVTYSQPTHLTVNIGPVFLTNGQPVSVSTNSCATAQFKVATKSCSLMTYQWRQNGVNVSAPNLAGANSDILIITNLIPANAGSYDVIVWNSHSSITSSVANLTLTNTPTVLAQPRSVTNHACTTPTLFVAATANCPLSYQWFFQGALLSGATASALNLTNAQPSQAGDYFALIATPFGGVTSQVAHITIQTNPVILVDPKSPALVRLCDIVNLSIQVQAEPSCSPLSYQWQLAGTNIVAPNSSVYSFTAQADTAGDYRCIISNPWASTTSRVATITVDARPLITSQPASSQRVRESASFTNQIGVSSCGSLNYSWQFMPLGGTVFTNVIPDTRHSLTTNGWLVVQNAQTNESGYYRVLLGNVYTNVTSTPGLARIVRPPPNDHFTNAISLGSGATVLASGYNEYATFEPGEPQHGRQNPNHSVWWVWTNPFPSLVTADTGGSDIDTLLGAYTGTNTGALIVIAEDDDGRPDKRSRVSFMAPAGQVLHFAVDGKNAAEGTNLLLSLQAAAITSSPVITEEPLSLAASPGQNVSFTTSSYGSPDITVQWFRQGTPLAGVTTILQLTNYRSVLNLNNLTTNDLGVYHAVLSNSFGSTNTTLVTLTFGSIVRGLVTDATQTSSNGAAIPVPGALVSIGNVSSITDSNGNYELVGVPLGEMRAEFMANTTRARLNENIQFWNRSTLTASLLTASKTNYYDYIDDQFEVGQGRTVAKRFSMSPIFNGLRFVLNWTNRPLDLDLRLYLPPAVPVAYHWVDYFQRGSSSSWPFAILDADVSSGWGPETISIHTFTNGTYSFYAGRYPGDPSAFLSGSYAQAIAYLGGNVTNLLSTQIRPYGSVTVPASGTNDWWHICDVDGATTNITWINQLLPSLPSDLNPQFVRPLVAGTRPGTINPRPNGDFPTNVDYEWNFGDGSLASSAPEPIHSYSDPGFKSITLRMTQRTGGSPKTITITKTNYVLIENAPPIVAITNPQADTIFRAGDPILLQSSADGIDDPIQRVDYYLITGVQTNFIGTSTNSPYTIVFANTNCLNCTNSFAAVARDIHGAATWSAPLATRIIDLSGDILIIRNFDSPEIAEMVSNFAGQAFIPEKDQFGNFFTRPPVINVLDQERLYFNLVRSFKLIIWDDQGLTDGGLSDNDVAVLHQAYNSGIPLYLIGERLAASRYNLADLEQFNNWTDLLGVHDVGPLLLVTNIHGVKATDPDGLFSGWFRGAEAKTDISSAPPLEWLGLTSSEMDIVANVPTSQGTNSPIMLRFPRFSEPDFGQTRRLIQDFRANSDLDYQSAEARRILLINGAAWLLRMFECPDLVTPGLDCGSSPVFGSIGTPITFTAILGQNSSCVAGGVLVTNQLSSRLQLISASIQPVFPGIPTNTYTVTIISNTAVAHFAEMLPNIPYQFTTEAIPRVGGWLTNSYTVSRGVASALPCLQTGFITGPACNAVRLSASLGTNNSPQLTVTGGLGCAFQLQISSDLQTWQSILEIQPGSDPFITEIPSLPGSVQFYRLLKLE